MTKKTPPDTQDSPLHLEVEEWQWKMPSRQGKFSWRQGLALFLFFSIILLLAFGFLLIAGVAFVIGLGVSLVLFFLKRLP